VTTGFDTDLKRGKQPPAKGSTDRHIHPSSSFLFAESPHAPIGSRVSILPFSRPNHVMPREALTHFFGL
jgi:hypothetical protein